LQKQRNKFPNGASGMGRVCVCERDGLEGLPLPLVNRTFGGPFVFEACRSVARLCSFSGEGGAQIKKKGMQMGRVSSIKIECCRRN